MLVRLKALISADLLETLNMCLRRLEKFLQHFENQRFQIFLNFLTFPLEMLQNDSVALRKEMQGNSKKKHFSCIRKEKTRRGSLKESELTAKLTFDAKSS